jgi:2-polyprenyl-3-methyl-5-hydroxy-6-metoxy-1,4-benzoquinol methylase
MVRKVSIRRSERSCLERVRPDQDTISRLVANPYYQEKYRSVEHLYWLHIPAWIDAFCADRVVDRILDVGCAYGTLLVHGKRITGAQPFGLDFIDAFMSPALAADQGIDFRIGNVELEALPWSHRFDMVIFTEVLEHFNFQAVPTLVKVRNAVSDRGRLFLSTPDSAEWGRTYKYYRRYADLPDPGLGHPIHDDHVWQFNRKELEAVVAEAGWQIRRLAYAPGDGRRHLNLEAVAG